MLKNDDDDQENDKNIENIDVQMTNNGANNVHYGTLQSMPAEQLMLKQQQQQGMTTMNSKKLKKKMRHHQALAHHHKIQYNSDDDLLMGSMVHNDKENENSLYSSTPPITITSLDEPQTTIDPSTIVHQQNLTFSLASGTSNSDASTVPSYGVSYQQCQTKQAKVPLVMPKIISVSGNGNGSKVTPPPGTITATHWWRLTNKARSLSRGQLVGSTAPIGAPENFYTTPGIRKQLSSESSDYSDGFK